MKNIHVTFEEGVFCHNWYLHITTKKGTKTFWLGQDSKFCSRVLGMDTSYVVNEIGGRDLREPKIQKALGKFIVNELKLTEEIVDNLQSWELACQ
jgi:hypothetical protein